MAKVYYETAAFKRLHKEWMQKLKDDGFVDIEKAHDRLRGTPSVSLSFLNPQHNKAGRSPDKQEDPSEDIDSAIVNFHEAYRARYYYHAQVLASEKAATASSSATDIYVIQLHATGMSQREIAGELQISRAQVRKTVEPFSRQVKILVDNEK